MFEQMLRELLLKLIREDTEIRDTINIFCGQVYDKSVKQAIKYTIENDEQVQDVIRKQATLDIGELIIEMIDHDDNVINSIRSMVQDKIDDLTFEVIVR
jgi:hypothetical protein